MDTVLEKGLLYNRYVEKGDFMVILKIILLSLGSIVVLFFLTKLMGNREISQLNMFDYIVGITIGSIAAEMSTSLEDNFWEPVVAMVVYGIVATGISYLTCKSIKFRRFVSGKGKISFLPISSKRPVTPEDLNTTPPYENTVINVIVDGVLLMENLNKTGNNMKWLEKELKKQNITNIKDVFLATCDNNKNLSVYVKWQKENKHDFFE